MDICHLKKAELASKLPKYKARVVLRGDIVKDDSEACTVFTEQDSSSSQVTAAKVRDVFARSPNCDAQSVDVVSAYTGKTGGRSQTAHKSQISMSTFMDASSTTQMAEIMGKIGDPVVLLERNLYGHPSAGLRWERQFEEALLEFGWETEDFTLSILAMKNTKKLSKKQKENWKDPCHQERK